MKIDPKHIRFIVYDNPTSGFMKRTVVAELTLRAEANQDTHSCDMTQGFNVVEATKERLAKELLACIDKDHLAVPPSPI